MNESRRKFLKTIIAAGGLIMIQKILGPLHSWFSSAFPDKVGKTNYAGQINFKVVKNDKGLSIYDSLGEEIFQIDNEA